MIVTAARPPALPGMFANVESAFTTAFAAMEAVPREATVELTRILPTWNMLFSIPDGRAILSILLIIAISISSFSGLSTCTSSFVLVIL